MTDNDDRSHAAWLTFMGHPGYKEDYAAKVHELFDASENAVLEDIMTNCMFAEVKESSGEPDTTFPFPT